MAKLRVWPSGRFAWVAMESCRDSEKVNLPVWILNIFSRVFWSFFGSGLVLGGDAYSLLIHWSSYEEPKAV